MINAFESAVSVDSKTLLDPLLKEFRFKSHTLLDLFVDHLDLVAPAQMLSYLRTLNLDWDDSDAVADLAFKFGTQQTDLNQVIESLGDFFIKIEDVDDAPVPDDIALLKLRKSRIEELRYIYNLGSISSNAPLSNQSSSSSRESPAPFSKNTCTQHGWPGLLRKSYRLKRSMHLSIKWTRNISHPER